MYFGPVARSFGARSNPSPDDPGFLPLFRQIVHWLPGDRLLVLHCADSSAANASRELVGERENVTTIRLEPTNGAADERLHYLGDACFDHAIIVGEPRSIAGASREHLFRVLKPAGNLVVLSAPSAPIHPDIWEAVGFVPSVVVRRTFRARPQGGIGTAAALITDCLPWLPTPLAVGIHCFRKPSVGARPVYRNLCRHAQLASRVSVVIPCRDEVDNLRPLVDGLRGHFGDYLLEIIPVDDNSRDGTGDLLRRLAAEDDVIRPQFVTGPGGVGRALAVGIDAARGSHVLLMDCDFHRLLPDIRHLFDAAAEGYDAVFGIRFARSTFLAGYPLTKLMANRAFHGLARLLISRHAWDVTNNLKPLRRRVLRRMRLQQSGFAVNAEIGLQPYLMGLDVARVPVSWSGREQGMGTSSFRLCRNALSYASVLGNAALARFLSLGPYGPRARRIRNPAPPQAAEACLPHGDTTKRMPG